jgi:hypothetical protein
VQVGDLVIRIINGEIGVITKIVAIDTNKYYWVYVCSSGKEQIFPEEMVRAMGTIKKE